MHRSHKIRLYPDRCQEQALRRACGVARFAYNWALEEWNRQYDAGLKPNKFSLRRHLNAIKRDQFPWMMEVTKCAPMEAILNLGRAFDKHFNGKARKPRFKKKGGMDSFRVGMETDNFRFSGKKIRLPKIGFVSLAEPLRWPSAKLLSVTIKVIADRWYAIVNMELPESVEAACVGESQVAQVVGIDLGLSSFAVLSTGEKIGHPRYLKNALPRLLRLGRALARKQPASANWRKAKRVLGRKHQEVVNSRSHFLHQLTADLTCRFDHISIEGLDVEGLLKMPQLARSIHESGFRQFRSLLEYKAKKLTVCNRWFPSTKICSGCGNRINKLPLSARSWECPKCGTVHDRDHNAAKNLAQTATRPEAISALAACGDLDGQSLKQEICTK